MSTPDSARWLELGYLVCDEGEQEHEYGVFVERAGLTLDNLALIRLCIANFNGEGKHVILRQEEVNPDA